MKSFLIAAVATLVSTHAIAADYAIIVIERPVNASAADTWKKIGPFCALRDWFSTQCDITKGNETDVGSIRSVAGGRVSEVLVAKTQYSYTYTFPAPNPTAYHGTVEVVPEGAKKAKIIYTLFFDQETIATAEAKAADKEQRRKRFTEGVEKMVKMAEGK